MSVMARSRKEFARLKLYASFVRGEVITFKPVDPLSGSSSTGGIASAASHSGSSTPLIQHKIMKSQLWNVQPAAVSTTHSVSPPSSTSTSQEQKLVRKLEKAAKRARKVEKETKRSEKQARRAARDQKRSLKAERKESQESKSEPSTTEATTVGTKRKRDPNNVGEDSVTGSKTKRKRYRSIEG
jgi:hypothetical protein